VVVAWKGAEAFHADLLAGAVSVMEGVPKIDCRAFPVRRRRTPALLREIVVASRSFAVAFVAWILGGLHVRTGLRDDSSDRLHPAYLGCVGWVALKAAAKEAVAQQQVDHWAGHPVHRMEPSSSQTLSTIALDPQQL